MPGASAEYAAMRRDPRWDGAAFLQDVNRIEVRADGS